MNPGEAGVGLVLRQLLRPHEARKTGPDIIEPALEEALLGIDKPYSQARHGTALRQAVAHGACSDNCNGLNLSHSSLLRQGGNSASVHRRIPSEIPFACRYFCSDGHNACGLLEAIKSATVFRKSKGREDIAGRNVATHGSHCQSLQKITLL